MRRRLALIAALPLLAMPALARASEKKKGGGVTFIQFATLTANIVRADGRRGVFTVEAGVDAPDPAVHERALGLTPRLRDAYSSTLQTFAASLRPQQAPDLDLLSRRLQADTDRVLGRKGARLLLGSCILN
jgi:hypothetical protein